MNLNKPSQSNDLSGAMLQPRIDEQQLNSIAELSRRSNSALLQQMIDNFQLNAPELADHLSKTARNTQDQARLQFLAHRFKGIAGNIGACRLMCLCEALERHLEEGFDEVFVMRACKAIADETLQVVPALRERRPESATNLT